MHRWQNECQSIKLLYKSGSSPGAGGVALEQQSKENNADLNQDLTLGTNDVNLLSKQLIFCSLFKIPFDLSYHIWSFFH